MNMKTIKVLVVDDSSVIRNIVTEILNQDSMIEVIGEAKDPYEAREKIKALNPDIITLDIEMPKMDGITFLKNLMRLRPMPVVMLSTLTTKGADITLQALEIGAVDFIAKPSFEELIASKINFQNTLLDKVKSAVGIDQKSYALAKNSMGNSSDRVLSFNGCPNENHIIAIGSSTGGTEAVKHILTQFPFNSPAVVITQHIPPTFSERFAQRLNAQCNISVQEAKHGQKIKMGHAYIAPGDKHLTVANKGNALFCVLEDSDPVNRHKPSVDVLFHSLLPIANNVQAVLLTGMGNDGAKGMLRLKENGARTIIQNRQTSLIWGMPGQAYKLNAHTDEMALHDIALTLLKYAAKNKELQKGLPT